MLESSISKKPRRKILISLCALLACMVVAAIMLLATRDTGPIPNGIQRSTAFTLYYPSSLPQGYTHRSNSTRQEAGMVFYALANDKRIVSISQQALPSNPPNLDTLSGFSKIEVSAGKAAVGSNGPSPTVLILTNASLITISGSQGTPQDVIASIAKDMTSLPE